MSNQIYVIEQNADPGSTNWIGYTNVVGDGRDAQITLPATNACGFFRFRAL